MRSNKTNFGSMLLDCLRVSNGHSHPLNSLDLQAFVFLAVQWLSLEGICLWHPNAKESLADSLPFMVASPNLVISQGNPTTGVLPL